jgi:uncharacterized protein YaaR (DUF327 family)
MGLKIDGGNAGRKPRSVTGGSSARSGRVHGTSSAQFSSHLGRHFGDAQEEALRKMAEEIETYGRRLAEHVDVADLRKYKLLVMEFMSEAVRSSSRFSKESFLDRRGRHRVYATVKSINEKLEQLTQEFLKAERDNISILARIEDIRGLILDLIL